MTCTEVIGHWWAGLGNEVAGCEVLGVRGLALSYWAKLGYGVGGCGVGGAGSGFNQFLTQLTAGSEISPNWCILTGGHFPHWQAHTEVSKYAVEGIAT